MGARGPASKAELAIISSQGISVVDRPKPPSELTLEQAGEWRSIVNAHAAERFPREQHPMLSAYCRHVIAQRRVAQLISAAEAAEEFDSDEYDKFLKMQERESRCLASLAVRLGFAYSTAYETKRPKKGGSARPKPWDIEG